MPGRSSLLALGLFLSACSKPAIYPDQCPAVLPKWKQPPQGYSILGIANRIHLQRDGSLKWNGQEISGLKLAEYAHLVSGLNPRPFTILQIDQGTDCSHVRVIRNLIDLQAKCQEYAGLCGEGNGPWARVGDVPPFPTFYPSNEANQN